MIARALTTIWQFQVNDEELRKAEDKLNALTGAFQKIATETASGIESLWNYKDGVSKVEEASKETTKSIEDLTESIKENEDQIEKTTQKTEELEKKFDKKKKAIDKVNDSFEEFSKIIKGGVIVYLGQLAAQIGTVWAFVSSTAAVADKVAKTADQLGFGVEALQEYRHAASLSGVAQDTLDASLKSFVIRVGEATQGTGEAVAAFKELGIVLKDSNGNLKTPEHLLSEIADKMAAIEDPTKRARLAMKLFETEGVGLVNLLKLGSAGMANLRNEARSLGLVISERDARNAEAFNDSFERLFGVMKGIKNQVSSGLFPVLTRLANKWRDFIVTNRAFIKSGINNFLSQTVTWLDKTSDSIFSMIETSRKVVAALGGLSNIVDVLKTSISLLAGLFIYLKWAMIKAQIVALAIPLLIAAAVIALALIIQDVIKWINGADSVMGDLIGKFTDFKELLKQKLYLDPLKFLQKTLENIVKAYQALKDVFTSSWDFFSSDNEANPLKGSANFVNSQGAENSATNVVKSISPTANPLPKTQLVSVDQRSIKNDFNMTVNAAPGQSPSEIGIAVKNELLKALREEEERKRRDARKEIEY